MASMVSYAAIASPGAALEIGVHHRAAVSTNATSSAAVVQVWGRRNAVSSSSSFRDAALQKVLVQGEVSSARSGREQRRWTGVARASSDVYGQDPEWSDGDYVVLGLAHCFRKDDNGKLKDAFTLEPVTAGTLECMENGGVTCYKHVHATTLGIALKQDPSLLPVELQAGTICDEFEFRAKCASRTWKREHPQQNLLHLAPKNGVRSDFNFNVTDKRVLNAEVVVNDSDNIKQDMSIDVYGRKKEEEIQAEISELYSV